jgi:hypothetical protein
MLTAMTFASIWLSGCARTVEIQVPNSDGKEFEACLIDPTTSYKPSPAEGHMPGGLVLGADANQVIKVAGGSDRLFVTNDQVTGDNLLSTDSAWATSLATRWHTSEAQLVQADSEAEQLWSHHVHQAFLTSYNQLSTPVLARLIQAAQS